MNAPGKTYHFDIRHQGGFGQLSAAGTSEVDALCALARALKRRHSHWQHITVEPRYAQGDARPEPAPIPYRKTRLQRAKSDE